MRRNSDNRRRAFADVVAIDAWHNSFDGKHSKVDLHADVVFGTARVGGDSKSPVRFRLSAKQAEVVVIIPKSEPVSVDKGSVAREAPETRGRLTETVEQATHSHAGGRISLSASPAELSASGSVTAGIEGSMSAKKKIEISGKVHFMIVTSSKTDEGHYRWIIKPTASQVLEGRPWDATKQPRLKIIDKRRDRSKGIPPTVRVEVRCRREDLLIDDLQIKDQGLWEKAKGRIGFKNKMAAAISYIRDRLTEEGLEVENIEDIFGNVTLASVTAKSI